MHRLGSEAWTAGCFVRRRDVTIPFQKLHVDLVLLRGFCQGARPLGRRTRGNAAKVVEPRGILWGSACQPDRWMRSSHTSISYQPAFTIITTTVLGLVESPDCSGMDQAAMPTGGGPFPVPDT